MPKINSQTVIDYNYCWLIYTFIVMFIDEVSVTA